MDAKGESASEASSKARIFISYSRKDVAFADRLEHALKARGFEPLIDREEIFAFEDWWKRIEALIGRADTVVFVLSPDAVASEVARKEVAHAASLNKRFAPLVYRRADDGAVPEPLRRLNFIFFDDPAQFEASADKLAEALETDIGWIRQHTEYGGAARRWTESGRLSGLLLRSPLLEEAERWIASRPRGAPEPTPDTQTFVVESRRGTTRRRNILTGSLAAGLVVALALAGLAFWQQRVADQQRLIAQQQQKIAEEQRKRAEDTLAAATRTANGLIGNLAERFRDSVGVPRDLVKDILERARALQDQLIKSGQLTPDLQRSEAEALMDSVDTLVEVGDTAGALAAGEEARQIFTDLVAGSPTNTDYQHELSTALGDLGNAQVANGDLSGALKSYRDRLDILDRLTQSDPANAAWQRELPYASITIGDVLVKQGDLAGALQSFRDSLAAAERAAQSNPDDADPQLDLSLAHERTGDVQAEQGDIAGALVSYRESLTIRQRLAQSHPGTTSLQRDLSIANNKVGRVRLAQGDLAGSLASYQGGLAIMERLVQSDSSNAAWQDDLALSQENVGSVQAKQGDLSGALTSDEAAIAILKRLTQSYPDNVIWQGHLAAAYGHVGNVQAARGDLSGALTSDQASLTLMKQLAQSHPGDGTLRHDLQIAANQMGGLAYSLELASDFPDALTASDQALLAAPDITWIQLNRAHALMFLGRTDEARALYLKYSGQKMPDTKTWEADVLGDFAEFRQKGLSDPLMDAIETAFQSAR